MKISESMGVLHSFTRNYVNMPVQRLPHNVTTYEATQRHRGLSPIMLSNTGSQADTWVQER